MGRFLAYKIAEEGSKLRKPYISPEILYNIQMQTGVQEMLEKYRYQTDIFFLGLTLMEMCTLKDSTDLYEIITQKIYTDEVEIRLGEIQKRYGQLFSYLIRKMLTIDPQQRPNTYQLINIMKTKQNIIPVQNMANEKADNFNNNIKYAQKNQQNFKSLEGSPHSAQFGNSSIQNHFLIQTDSFNTNNYLSEHKIQSTKSNSQYNQQIQKQLFQSINNSPKKAMCMQATQQNSVQKYQAKQFYNVNTKERSSSLYNMPVQMSSSCKNSSLLQKQNQYFQQQPKTQKVINSSPTNSLHLYPFSNQNQSNLRHFSNINQESSQKNTNQQKPNTQVQKGLRLVGTHQQQMDLQQNNMQQQQQNLVISQPQSPSQVNQYQIKNFNNNLQNSNHSNSLKQVPSMQNYAHRSCSLNIQQRQNENSVMAFNNLNLSNHKYQQQSPQISTQQIQIPTQQMQPIYTQNISNVPVQIIQVSPKSRNQISSHQLQNQQRKAIMQTNLPNQKIIQQENNKQENYTINNKFLEQQRSSSLYQQQQNIKPKQIVITQQNPQHNANKSYQKNLIYEQIIEKAKKQRENNSQIHGYQQNNSKQLKTNQNEDLDLYKISITPLSYKMDPNVFNYNNAMEMTKKQEDQQSKNIPGVIYTESQEENQSESCYNMRLQQSSYINSPYQRLINPQKNIQLQDQGQNKFKYYQQNKQDSLDCVVIDNGNEGNLEELVQNCSQLYNKSRSNSYISNQVSAEQFDKETVRKTYNNRQQTNQSEILPQQNQGLHQSQLSHISSSNYRCLDQKVNDLNEKIQKTLEKSWQITNSQNEENGYLNNQEFIFPQPIPKQQCYYGDY